MVGSGGDWEQEEPQKLLFFQPCGWPIPPTPRTRINACLGDTPAIPPAVQLSETDAVADK